MSSVPSSLSLQGDRESGTDRSLYSTAVVAPGDIIAVFEPPGLAIPTSAYLTESCSHCLQTASPDAQVRACTGCRTTHYCRVKCQKADWALVHKEECKVFKQIRSSGNDPANLPTPVRALVQILLRPEVKTAVDVLEGHVKDIRSQASDWKDLELQATAALHYLGRSPDGLREALDILCKLQINSFTKADEESVHSALFLHPALAMANHSCLPNAFVQFFGRKPVLRAYQAIAQGEEVRISYIDEALHRSHRQQTLRSRYFFECTCPRCSEDLGVYQVARSYPHLELNKASIAPKDFHHGKSVGIPSLDETPAARQIVEDIYATCSAPLASLPGHQNRGAVLKKRYETCAPLIKLNVHCEAIDPLAQVYVDACNLLASQGRYARSLALACRLAICSDCYRCPMPFAPRRVDRLLMIARLLSNTAESAATSAQGQSEPNKKDASVDTSMSHVLYKIDQVTLAQAILTVALRYSAVALAERSQEIEEAWLQLQEIEGLPGRERENGIVREWMKTPDGAQAQDFYSEAVLNPFTMLGGFTDRIMREGLMDGDRYAMVR